MTTVYFATNRLPDAQATYGFGTDIADYKIEQISFAAAEIQAIRLANESSGNIVKIRDVSAGDFSPAVQNEIVSAGKNILVFIHGFGNSFEDALKRAAFNREWIASTHAASADMTVLAFSWPSAGTLFAAPPHMLPGPYLSDQAQAGRSAFHVAYFLRVIARLRASFKAANPQGRMVLLAHSMGNFALASACSFGKAPKYRTEFFSTTPFWRRPTRWLRPLPNRTADGCRICLRSQAA